jgi:hypothetical protein
MGRAAALSYFVGPEREMKGKGTVAVPGDGLGPRHPGGKAIKAIKIFTDPN